MEIISKKCEIEAKGIDLRLVLKNNNSTKDRISENASYIHLIWNDIRTYLGY